MSITSKSPRAVVLAAYAVARESLPAYSHVFSPKKFTQHQLFACLVLKAFLKTDYRGLTAHLRDCPSLGEAIHLRQVPHYTTLQKAAHRLLAALPARRLLATTVRRHMNRKKRVPRAAMDSTGLESSPASPYFVRRRAATGSPWKSMVYHRFPRLAILCTTDSHFVLGYRSSRGPRPDVVDFQPLLADALGRVRLTTVMADAGYDSEANHRFGRETCHVRTMIPANRGPQTNKPAQGRYRRLMQTRFDADLYRDRCQVETVVSMIKRRQESFLRTRTYWSQCRDLRLKVLTHNIMILRRTKVFYRAGLSHFFSSTIRSRWWSAEKLGQSPADLKLLPQTSPLPHLGGDTTLPSSPNTSPQAIVKFRPWRRSKIANGRQNS